MAAPSALAATGSIAGTVTDASTAGALQGEQVTVFNSSDSFVAAATTTSSGGFTVSGLGAGTYEVEFSGGNYLPQFYNDKPTLASANPVTVTAGMTTPGINAAMQPGGKITGKVTDASTTHAIQSVPVAAYNSSGAFVAIACTAIDGTYTLSALASGTYHVGFAPSSIFGGFCGPTLNYLPQFYNGKPSLASADPVTVTAGMTTAGINAALQPGGKITGKVTDSSTTSAIQGALVEAYNSSGSIVASACTAADGTYTISALASGTYHVGFTTGGFPPICSATANYLPQFYHGKPSLASADPVAVTAGMTTSRINAALRSGGKITGKVTDAATTNPIQNVPVQAYNSSGTFVASACTAADGTYTISGLASGTYRVGFVSGFGSCGAGVNYLPQFYNDKTSLATANPVTATAGMTTTGINAALQSAGKITGRATDVSTTNPIQNVPVTVYSASGTFVASACTAADGTYTISGLASGTYHVGFMSGFSFCGPTLNYLPQFYNDKTSLATADPVTVTAGMTTTGINAALQPGGKITGKVTDALTTNPIQGVLVEAYNSSGNVVASMCTAADGTYALAGFATGTYHVGFTTNGFPPICPTNSNYLPQFYHGKPSLASADPVAVTAGMTTSRINAALRSGGKITGKVTDAATTNPIQNVPVQAYNSSGTFVASACTAADGTYTISGLATGTYHLGFAPSSAFGGPCGAPVNYLPQFYNDKPSLATANPVAVTAGMTTAGINAALQPGGKITGKATDAVTTNPIQNVPVAAYNSSGAFVASGCTAADGTYTLSALASGTYHVGFMSGFGFCGPALNYAPQFYNGKPSLATADPVAVTAGMTTAGINAALQAAGKITGRVTDAATTNPVQGVFVQAYNSSGGVVTSACTAADGTYTLSGFAAGTYRVGFTPGPFPPFCSASSKYIAQFYNDKPSLATADPVTVTSGMTTASINAALASSAGTHTHLHAHRRGRNASRGNGLSAQASGPSDRARFETLANSVCRAVGAGGAAPPSPLHSAALRSYVLAGLAVARRTGTSLSRVPAPAALEPAIERVVADYARLTALYTTAAYSRPGSKAQATVIDLVRTAEEKTTLDAMTGGVPACAPVAPGVGAQGQ